MRTVRIALFASLAACSASAAWAQYGLYGSPETLPVSQQQTVAQAYPAPTNYPTTATPAAQPAPTYYYAPRPQPQPQPQYRYPVQSPAATAYQPYQPGAQYRYPGPYATRPPVRTAAVEQPQMIQPMPAPPGMPTDTNAPVPVPAPQGPGMMNQMVNEQNGYAGNNGCAPCGPYSGAMGRFEQAACGPYSEGCAYDGNCDQGCYCCPWYGSISALVMGRSEGRRVWTTYEYGNDTNQLTNTDFPLQWKWGGEVRFGRRFCCGCVPYALEASYWTTEAMTGYRSTSLPGGRVSTPLNISPMTFGGVAATSWFDNAQEHRLWRRDEFHNIEVNLIREQLAWACDSPWDIGWSVGVRFFRFEDFLQFGSVAGGHTFGEAGGIYEAYLSDNITNNLLGAQFGFDAAYNVFDGVRLFITPKVGIYNNYLESNFQAHTGAGVNGVGPYGSFPVHSTRNGLSFLTQIDVGADWQFARNWSARVGYRVVAVTGVGTADDQIPQYIVDTPEIANIQHSSSLLLHGAFAGLTYNF